MKKYIIIAAIALFIAGCENTEYNRGLITKRGNEIYNAWNSQAVLLNSIVNRHTFALNQILQAKSKEQADSIYNKYLLDYRCEITTHADGVYQIRNVKRTDCYYSQEISFLVLTDGNDLNTPGTEWNIILNIPADYVYQPMTRQMNRDSPVYYDDCERISGGIPYLPFTVTCTDTDTWTWKDYNPKSETTRFFSINCTVRKEPEEIVSGLVVDFLYRYTGKGRFSVNQNANYIDYEMNGILSGGKRNLDWVSGTMILTARSERYEEEIPVSVSFSSNGRKITYQGVTEEYGY